MIDFNCRLFDGHAQSGLQGPAFEAALARWFEQMNDKGPELVVAHSNDAVERALVIQAAAQHPQRFAALGAVLPRDKGDVAATLRALEGGFLRGVCLFPTVQGYGLDDPDLNALLEQCHAYHALIVPRLGMPPAVLRDADAVRWNMAAMNPLALVPLADRYPELRFVLPSFGGGFLRETLMLGELCANVYLDTTQPTAWLRTQVLPVTLEDVFERALGVFGVHRLLFATGSTSAAPGWRGDWATLQREALGAIELGAEERALIFGGNAIELLAG